MLAHPPARLPACLLTVRRPAAFSTLHARAYTSHTHRTAPRLFFTYDYDCASIPSVLSSIDPPSRSVRTKHPTPRCGSVIIIRPYIVRRLYIRPGRSARVESRWCRRRRRRRLRLRSCTLRHAQGTGGATECRRAANHSIDLRLSVTLGYMTCIDVPCSCPTP